MADFTPPHPHTHSNVGTSANSWTFPLVRPGVRTPSRGIAQSTFNAYGTAFVPPRTPLTRRNRPHAYTGFSIVILTRSVAVQEHRAESGTHAINTKLWGREKFVGPSVRSPDAPELNAEDTMSRNWWPYKFTSGQQLELAS